MPELVDRLAGGSSPAAGGPTSSDQGGDGSSRRNRDAESRIQQINAEKKQYRALAEQGAQERRELREEVAELRGMIKANGQPSKPISAWTEVEDLSGALKVGLNPENPNPDAVYNAMDEMIKRRFDSFKTDILEQGRAEHLQSDISRQVRSEIEQKFGAESRDSSSPLFERAAAYAQLFKQRYGDDVMDRQPDMEFDAFSRARADLTAGQSDRIKELEAQLDSLKASGSMEPGSGAVAPQNDAYRDAMKNRDTKSAIRALQSVQSFNQRR